MKKSGDEDDWTREEEKDPFYRLRLFIAGASPASVRAIKNLQLLLEERLKGRYELDIVDVRQQPLIAIRENITAIPMLIKTAPIPKRLLVGDMSNTDRVRRGLGL